MFRDIVRVQFAFDGGDSEHLFRVPLAGVWEVAEGVPEGVRDHLWHSREQDTGNVGHGGCLSMDQKYRLGDGR
jgi:hypothetical protein